MAKHSSAGAALVGILAILAACTSTAPTISPTAIASPLATLSGSATPDLTEAPTATIAPSLAPTPDPTPTPTLEPTPPPPGDLGAVGRIAPMPGWTSLVRFSSNRLDERGTTIVDIEKPSDLHAMLISTACDGAGTVEIDDGEDGWTVACPASASSPVRDLTFDDGAQFATIEAHSVDGAAFRILVEGAPSVLDWPTVHIGEASPRDEMVIGCGISYELHWGFQAGDGCGVSIGERAAAVTAAPDGTVVLRVRDWSIRSASVRCGVLDDDDGRLLFEARARCAVTIAIDGRRITVSGIPSRASPWVLQLGLSAVNDLDDQANVPYYANVSR